MLHLLEDKITEKKSTSVVFDCEVEFSWSLSQHTMLYDLNLLMGLRGQSSTNQRPAISRLPELYCIGFIISGCCVCMLNA